MARPYFLSLNSCVSRDIRGKYLRWGKELKRDRNAVQVWGDCYVQLLWGRETTEKDEAWGFVSAACMCSCGKEGCLSEQSHQNKSVSFLFCLFTYVSEVCLFGQLAILFLAGKVQLNPWIMWIGTTALKSRKLHWCISVVAYSKLERSIM